MVSIYFSYISSRCLEMLFVVGLKEVFHIVCIGNQGILTFVVTGSVREVEYFQIEK